MNDSGAAGEVVSSSVGAAGYRFGACKGGGRFGERGGGGDQKEAERERPIGEKGRRSYFGNWGKLGERENRGRDGRDREIMRGREHRRRRRRWRRWREVGRRSAPGRKGRENSSLIATVE